jgi:hypothetical protein
MNNFNIEDQLNKPVKCVNLIKDDNTGNLYCKYLTDRTGELFSANNKALCNFICSKKGPYNNKPISTNEEKNFVVESIKKLNQPSKEKIQNILNNYKLNFDFKIPKYYDEIKNNLEFLKNYQGFIKFTLTGPTITINSGIEYVDIDVVVWFDSLENYLNQQVQEKLPKNIYNKNVNYYIYTGKEEDIHSLFFSQLDVENKIIYFSKWFNMRIRSIPATFIVNDCAYEGYDIEFFENINEKDKENIKGKVGWGSVVDSWNKASQFIDAVQSRGVISTVLDYAGIDNSGGDRVSDEIYNLRRESCFGNDQKNIKPCQFLSKDSDDMYFCKACGCGTNKLAVLNPTKENGYSKLHYPNLECPLANPGFSNHKPD